eukprot:PhM_4_TR11409/c0_g1_i1/m.71282/K17609/NXN; nucleoredoxin
MSMSVFRQLFLLDNIFRGRNSESVESNLDGKTVMLYFSASWCPPCRAFTPKLKSYYGYLPKDKAEIVLISLDEGEYAFWRYYNDMPWMAMPLFRFHSDRLMGMYGLQTIPSLVVLNPDGSVLTRHGAALVMADPKAKHFPYTEDSVDRILAEGPKDGGCSVM